MSAPPPQSAIAPPSATPSSSNSTMDSLTSTASSLFSKLERNVQHVRLDMNRNITNINKKMTEKLDTAKFNSLFKIPPDEALFMGTFIYFFCIPFCRSQYDFLIVILGVSTSFPFSCCVTERDLLLFFFEILLSRGCNFNLLLMNSQRDSVQSIYNGRSFDWILVSNSKTRLFLL
eukprot:TRINITY_DN5174_c0_g1_i1.p1 TRINITY_DN5174_c0_g1~~TRINITY_DN5174_c0_g1_i1.p1  ORF type:complete len:175 (+),score=26.64 TRINITY_DN5174_c0_g1_i1:59-583(+)